MLNPITKNERILLMVVVRISAILGILGGVYIFKQRLSQAQLFRNHMGRIMVALAISDILNAIVALLGVEYIPYSATLCTIQAVLMYMANLSSAFLGLNLAGSAFYIVVLKGNTAKLLEYQTMVLSGCFILPFTIATSFAFIPIQPPFYAETDLWCWIRDSNHRIYYFYVILWFTIVLLIISYALTWKQLMYYILSRRYKKERPAQCIDETEELLLRLIMAYIGSVVISWVPGSLNRINDWIEFGPKFPFTLCQAVVAPARGLWNALAFYITFKKSQTVKGLEKCIERPCEQTRTEDLVFGPRSTVKLPTKPVYNTMTGEGPIVDFEALNAMDLEHRLNAQPSTFTMSHGTKSHLSINSIAFSPIIRDMDSLYETIISDGETPMNDE